MTIESSRPVTEVDLARAEPFTLGPLRVNPPTLEVTIGERREIIEPRIMQVFVALVRHKGEVVSRDQLIASCWGSRAVGDDAITRCIARLRKLAKAEGAFTIETIPRVGYRLKPMPDKRVRVPVWHQLDLKESAPSRFITSHIGRREITMAAIVVLLVITAAVYRLAPGEGLLSAATLDRVAVLPFESLSPENSARYFGDAVADQIVGVLNANQVQAVSRANSAALRGPGRDASAKKLGVEFILDGTVQRSAKGLRVTVHLDRASTHSTLWTANFESAGEDPIELQAQVAAKAVDEVKSALRAHGIDDAALSAYLSAQEFARTGGKPATQARRELLRTVIQRAPKLSLGHSGYALTSAMLVPFALPGEAKRLQQQAQQSAKRALELDPHNGEAYYALIKLAHPRQIMEREALFQKGLALDPDEPTLNSAYGSLLADEGRLAKALEYQQKAVMLDALSPQKTAGLASSLVLVGRLAEARATIERASRLWPTNPGVWLTRFYILSNFGYPEEAYAMLDDRSHAPTSFEAEFFAAARLGLDAVVDGSPKKSVAARAAILAAHEHGLIGISSAIEVLARIGEVDAAFALADQAYAPNGDSINDTDILFRPTTAAMRTDPRFRDLMVRLKFFDAWSAGLPLPDFCTSEDVTLCRELRRS